MGNSALLGLKPEAVFKYFEEISSIPRGSGNEKGISDYLVNFATARKLEVIQDSVLNIIIKKKGTKGYENSPKVIIQGHLDMVCEKNMDTVHDFDKDPIKLVVEGDMIRTIGTTMGADNGIAIAYAMALLDSNDLTHPPLEILLTTDEETGMSGAIGINPEDIQGRILINIDSEEEGKLLVSCAGGLKSKVTLPIIWERLDIPYTECIIKIRGLKGGHSGMEINKERGNSNRIMGRILVDLLSKVEYRISEINGGSKNNAIPREMNANILLKEETLPMLKEFIDDWNKILRNEYKVADPALKVQLEVVQSKKALKVFSKATTEKAVKLLFLLPNGIQSMNLEIPGLVQSSTNLGVVRTSEDVITYDSAVRSSVKSLKRDIFTQTKLIGEAYGAEVITQAEYPEWQYDKNSKIRGVFQRVYKEKYGKEPEIIAIHAGVECGLFKEKFGEIDMISFGPNIYDVHTPDEHFSVSSAERSWEFLIAVLEQMK